MSLGSRRQIRNEDASLICSGRWNYCKNAISENLQHVCMSGEESWDALPVRLQGFHSTENT